jgi:type IV pilus assembly protein PilA
LFFRTRMDQRGLTLVELLVVVLIIGILAAIALPAFTGQRGKAQDSEAKTAARNAATALETYFTREVTYVGATTARLQAIEPSLKGAKGLKLSSLGATTYAVSVSSKSPAATVYTVSRMATGAVVRRCDDKGVNGCRKSGVW